MQRRTLVAFLLPLAAVACWNWPTLTQSLPVLDGSTGDAAACTNVSSVAEDCSNGIDDNGNCLVDCADQDCKWLPVCRPDLATPADMTVIDMTPMD